MQLLPMLVAKVLALSALTGTNFSPPILPDNEPQRPVVTTLCEVIRHREKWEGKRVQFRASVISDGIDHTALADPGCRFRVIPRISEQNSNRTDVQRFRRAVFVDPPRGTAFKTISATFVGKLAWERRGVAVLEVEEVKDLAVAERDRE